MTRIIDFDLAKKGLETTEDICERAKKLKRIVVLGWDDENYFTAIPILQTGKLCT
jgi:hypothetical protein